MHINLDTLVEFDACEKGILKFRHLYPDGIDLDTSRTIITTDNDVGWLLGKVAFPRYKNDNLECVYKDGVLDHTFLDGVKTEYIYDSRGNQIMSVTGDSYWRKQEYNDQDKLVLLHDSTGNGFIRNRYDSTGKRLLSSVGSDGVLSVYEYDGQDRLVCVKRRDRIFLTKEYNDEGLLSRQTNYGHELKTVYEYEYNDAGLTISVSHNTFWINYSNKRTSAVEDISYDDEGRISRRSKKSNATGYELVATYKDGIVETRSDTDVNNFKPYEFEYE